MQQSAGMYHDIFTFSSSRNEEVVLFQKGNKRASSFLKALSSFSLHELLGYLKHLQIHLETIWAGRSQFVMHFERKYARRKVYLKNIQYGSKVYASRAYMLLKSNYPRVITGLVTVVFLTMLPIMYLGSTNAKENAPAKVATVSPAPTPTPTPAVGLPRTLSIPSLHISAPVQHVGYEEGERIGAPNNFTDVAWFMGSQKPGEVGSAFISGHFDTNTGAPAVFYTLTILKMGDTIEIYDELQMKYTFVVTEISEFPINNLPVDHIFGPTQKKRLFLVTCKGVFDPALGTYTHRALIGAELRSAEKIPTQ